jgi:hypothetical protein
LKELFDIFPYLESGRLVIRKMDEADVDALAEITDNGNIYRYIPPFLYKRAGVACLRPSGTWTEGILTRRSASPRACT